MNKLKALDLQTQDNSQNGKKGGFSLKKLTLGIIILVAVLVAVSSLTDSSSTSVFYKVLGQENILKLDEYGRVNVLLLGMAGGKHDGATLTDTIMVASYSPETKQVDLISLPRDVWSEKYRTKINALYQLGETKGEDSSFVRNEIGGLLGMSLPYSIRIDFSGFVKAVDLVEGIEVDVTRSFDDYHYPIEGEEDNLCEYKEELVDVDEEKSKQLNIPVGKRKILFDKSGQIATSAAEVEKDIIYTDQQIYDYFGCRFEHLTFKAGKTVMDGETALKFVRSRHGTAGEGSDFARSKRQQQILQAFKAKVLSIGTLADLPKMFSLVNTFGESLETNIKESEYLEFVKIGKEMSAVKSHVIEPTGPQALLIAPPPTNYGGAWVLIPKNNDFSKIHLFIDNILMGVEPATGSATEVN